MPLRPSNVDRDGIRVFDGALRVRLGVRLGTVQGVEHSGALWSRQDQVERLGMKTPLDREARRDDLRQHGSCLSHRSDQICEPAGIKLPKCRITPHVHPREAVCSRAGPIGALHDPADIG